MPSCGKTNRAWTTRLLDRDAYLRAISVALATGYALLAPQAAEYKVAGSSGPAQVAATYFHLSCVGFHPMYDCGKGFEAELIELSELP